MNNSSTYFPWGILIYLGIKYLLKGEKKESSSIAQDSIKPIYTKKTIQYLVNGNCIGMSHLQYYLEKLDLDNCERISFHTIMDSAKKKIIKEMEQNNMDHTNTLELLAARDYLLDQWCYVTFENSNYPFKEKIF